MQPVQIICGDAATVISRLPESAFDMCVTSPPYYGLRDYETPGQIGLGTTPEEYIQALVSVFREVRRVLRPDGTLWVNIGDSYATSSGPQPPRNTRNSQGHTSKTVPDGYKRKDLIGVPWMLAFALRADGWYLRQDIIWHKTNGMPESVRDRCVKAHEYIFLLSKSPTYYFDAEAISEPIAESSKRRYMEDIQAQQGSSRIPGKTMRAALPRFGGQKYGDDPSPAARTKSGGLYIPTLRRNKRDVWPMATAHYKGAHFAVFPEALAQTCILAGSRPGGRIIDPFMGSGTSGIVAVKNNRTFTGVDINPDYCTLAQDRISEYLAPLFMTAQ